MIHSQSAPTNVEWPVVAGNPGGMRYSPLKQINASNVNQLQVAWSYDVSDGAGHPGNEPDRRQRRSLRIYARAESLCGERSDGAAALEVRLWRSGQGKQPRRRLLAQRIGRADLRGHSAEFVYSLDAKTGKPDPKFGVRRAHRFPCRPARWSRRHGGRARASARHLQGPGDFRGPHRARTCRSLQATSARTTRGPASSGGRSTRFRIRASSDTTRGRRMPGPIRAMSLPGRA